MKSSVTIIAVAGIVAACCWVMTFPAGVALADWDNYSWATCATDEPVSLALRPDGNGQPFTAAYAWWGALTDASITVYCVDGYMDPIPDYPAEDIWLEWYGGTVVFCVGGNIADGPSDANGMTSFTASPRAGGYGDTEGGHGLQVVMNGTPLMQPPFAIAANSPDLTGDLVVDIADVAKFTQLWFSDYDYRIDFYWDGIINIADVALFVQGLGSACP